MPVEKLLERLEKVKVSGENKWLACCPAHPDKNPSLSVQDNGGKVLIKCWAGCGALDVITAVGLEWADLFPPNDDWRPERKQPNSRLDRLITETLGHLSAANIDEIIVDLARADVAKGIRHSAEDKARIREAIRNNARRSAA